MLVTPSDRARDQARRQPQASFRDQVKALRETISTVENGQRMTYPFDVVAIAPDLR